MNMGIDTTIMTPEAIALRAGEEVRVDGVLVQFTPSGKLSVQLSADMKDGFITAWLRKNAKVIGYVPINAEEVPEKIEVKKVKVKRDTEDFAPLEPYTEV